MTMASSVMFGNDGSPEPSGHVGQAPSRPQNPAFTQAAIRSLAQSAAFLEAGIVSLPHPDAPLDAQRFEQFIGAGHAGDMQYLARRNEAGELIRANVRTPFPWARSVIVCVASYHTPAPLSTGPATPNAGWIARYAWSGRPALAGESTPKGTDPTRLRPSDYHKVLLKRLRALESAMRAAYGGFESRAYVDTGPIVERAAARAAGLGWTGKNTCLIHPQFGSWNFLAVLVTSLPLAADDAALAVPDRCGSCRRCLDACPTNALIDPYRMDATRCISYLTIEHRGDIDDDLKSGIGRQVFGCDICQDVCPWNGLAARKTPDARGDAELATRQELVNPDLEWLASLEVADFERLFNGSPVRRTGFAGLRRNVAIAMGNTGLQRYRDRLEGWARTPERHADGSDSKSGPTPLQSAARWALRQLDARAGER